MKRRKILRLLSLIPFAPLVKETQYEKDKRTVNQARDHLFNLTYKVRNQKELDKIPKYIPEGMSITVKLSPYFPPGVVMIEGFHGGGKVEFKGREMT